MHSIIHHFSQHHCLHTQRSTARIVTITAALWLAEMTLHRRFSLKSVLLDVMRILTVASRDLKGGGPSLLAMHTRQRDNWARERPV
jgi:hypothetical protein